MEYEMITKSVHVHQYMSVHTPTSIVIYAILQYLSKFTLTGNQEQRLLAAYAIRNIHIYSISYPRHAARRKRMWASRLSSSA
jgi:hypothetical protein